LGGLSVFEHWHGIFVDRSCHASFDVARRLLLVGIHGYDRKTIMSALQHQFGQIDIYLFDQLLRGRITQGMRVLDAGCGHGRNLVYLLREGYDVFGADADPRAVEAVRHLAAALAPALPPDNFRVEPMESMSFTDAFADVVISSAVLHFARDEEHFLAMLRGSWRMVRPRGLFFCRLASSIGIETQVKRLSGRRFLLPDGSERCLVDEALLMSLTQQLGGELADPLKTTVVQNQRSMTTWVVRKDQ
jgi:tellurite methyltransferase